MTGRVSPAASKGSRFHEIVDDNCPGMAARLGFYFLLALCPALLFCVALIG